MSAVTPTPADQPERPGNKDGKHWETPCSGECGKQSVPIGDAVSQHRYPRGPQSPWTVATLPVTTAGRWATEADSWAALDRILDSCGLFTVYREVAGEILQPRPGQRDRTVRIDRLLTPTAQLIGAGWRYGAVGVEAKRSGEKIGPPLAQIVDYGRSAFTIRGGLRVWLDWVFLWPLDKQHGTVASFMAQNRLGSAWTSPWRPLELYSGEGRVLTVDRYGRPDIGPAVTNGKRTGSR